MNDTSPGRPVLVGFDPQSLDSSPARFALAVARLTGSPLIIAAVSAPAPVVDLQSRGGDEEGLDTVPEHAFAALEADLGATGVTTEYREISGVSAARALYEEAEREQAPAARARERRGRRHRHLRRRPGRDAHRRLGEP